MAPLPLLVLLLAAAPIQVQAGAPLGGDGTRERPFAHVQDALQLARPGATIALGPGIYEEQLELSQPVTLQGADGAILAGPPGAPFAVRIRASSTLEHLTVQGGRLGIDLASGTARLSHLRLRGQAEAAIAVGPGATAHVLDVETQCSLASAVGLHVEGEVEAARIAFTGPFRRAVEVVGGRLRGSELRVVEAGTGLHLSRGRAELHGLEVRDVRGSALFAEASEVLVQDAVVRGGELGFEVRAGTVLTVNGAVLAGASRAAVAGVQSTLRLRDAVCIGPFSHAAIEVLGGDARLEDVRLSRPGEQGVLGRLARISYARLTVDGAKVNRDDAGNALFLYDCQVQGVELLARSCEGPAVESQLGHGRIAGTWVERAGLAGVALEHGAELEILGLDVSGASGAGLACIESGKARVLLPRLQLSTPFLVDTTCRVTCSPSSLCAGAPGH
jgi:hypothetical protein